MRMHLLCVGLGATMILVGFAVRRIPPEWFECACLAFNEEPKDSDEAEAATDVVDLFKNSSTHRRRKTTSKGASPEQMPTVDLVQRQKSLPAFSE